MSYNHMKEKIVFLHVRELCKDTYSELMFTDHTTLIMETMLGTHLLQRSYIIQNRALSSETSGQLQIRSNIDFAVLCKQKR